MPTYDYKCTCCDHEMEKWQPFNADPLKVCPVCGQDTLKRIINFSGGIVFKGSGYYSVDNRKT